MQSSLVSSPESSPRCPPTSGGRDPVAYSDRWLLKQLSKNWSEVEIVEGRWRRGGMTPPFQDVVVLTK